MISRQEIFRDLNLSPYPQATGLQPGDQIENVLSHLLTLISLYTTSAIYLEVDTCDKFCFITAEIAASIGDICWFSTAAKWDRGIESSSVLGNIFFAKEK